MADLKRFLDFPGLSEYDKLIKEYIKTGSTDEIEKILDTLAEIAEKDVAQDQAITILTGDADTEGSVDFKVKKAIDDLVANAPEALDTLKEIADWISEDETGTAALVKRVAKNEEDIAANAEKIEDVYNSIVSIEDLKIASLFPAKQAAGESAVAAIAALEDGKAIQLSAEQTITENLTIDKSCYIDANGSTFEGTVTVPANAEVIIENAVFSNPVVMA